VRKAFNEENVISKAIDDIKKMLTPQMWKQYLAFCENAFVCPSKDYSSKAVK
jgi:hypothetical protein